MYGVVWGALTKIISRKQGLLINTLQKFKNIAVVTLSKPFKTAANIILEIHHFLKNLSDFPHLGFYGGHKFAYRGRFLFSF